MREREDRYDFTENRNDAILQINGGVIDYIVNSIETTGHHFENIKLNSYITLDTKMNSRWVKGLNVINAATNVHKEITDHYYHSVGVGQALLRKT